MENIEKCECWIGVRYCYEDTDLVTLADLKEHIEIHNKMVEYQKKYGYPAQKEKKLADYCDKRESTDFTRFNYCPHCGKKIDWKAIKGGANG